MGQAERRGRSTEGFNGTDEDVLTEALFPQVAPGFFATRPEGPKNVGTDPAEAGEGGGGAPPPDAVRTHIKYQVTVDGTSHVVSVDPA